MQSALGSYAQRRLHALLLCAAAIAAGPLGCGNERKLQGETETATVTCSRCHGNADNAAPPLSVKGDRDATDMAVGAHQAHLRGGALRAPLACSDCHLLPESANVASHIDGHATVTFGALAWMGGASPEWIAETGSCSATYCHGGTLAGGALTAPVWNRGAAEAACGACHGLPPPPPHVQNPDCGRCHVGYTATSVVAATHVDGKVDLKRLECNGCHGSDDERRPAHRDRRRDRHDGPRGRRAPAAPARRRHPLAPHVHGLPRPPVRDAPRERNRRAPLGRARDRRRRDHPGLEPHDRDMRGDLLPWRHAHARRRRGAHRSRLDAGRRRSDRVRLLPRGAPGPAAPPADRLRPVPPWHDDRRWRDRRRGRPAHRRHPGRRAGHLHDVPRHRGREPGAAGRNARRDRDLRDRGRRAPEARPRRRDPQGPRLRGVSREADGDAPR